MILAIFFILMRAVSLTFYMPMDVTVHNQYSGLELTTPVCFCDGRMYNEYSVERMDDGTVMKIGFRFGLNQFEGVLMCEVQGNRSTEFDHQSSNDTASTEAVENTSKMMRLLVTWEVKHSWKLSVRVVLIEYDNRLVLNEDKLVQSYNKVNNIPSTVYNWTRKYDGVYKSAWLIHDNTVLEAMDEIICEKGLELNITVTEGTKDMYAESALWVDSER
jgi:hypothetical protein